MTWFLLHVVIFL